MSDKGGGSNPGEEIVSVRCDEDELHVEFADVRRLSVPLSWYPRLARATAAQRANWIISAAGFGIHWPDVDEDLSAEGLLRGAPAPGARARSA
jgi:hypothetical protein